MNIATLREDLEQSLSLLEATNDADPKMKAAVERIKHALREAGPHTLLTTTEAAEALGVRSGYIVKLWSALGFIHGVEQGDHTMIPLSEIERVADSDQVRAIRASDVLHAESSDLGIPEGLTDEQLLDLKASRPGKQPWERLEAQFVVSENTHDYPPRQVDGRHIYEGIEYLSGQAFLDRLAASTLQ